MDAAQQAAIMSVLAPHLAAQAAQQSAAAASSSTSTPPTATSGVMDENKLRKYKTVMCQRMVRNGACRYGVLCDFAHDETELRRNLTLHWYYGMKCEKTECEPTCRMAHNDNEIMYHPHIYKTKLCVNAPKPGGCPKKLYCSFAHGKHELRQPKFTTGPGQPPLLPGQTPTSTSPSSLPPGTAAPTSSTSSATTTTTHAVAQRSPVLNGMMIPTTSQQQQQQQQQQPPPQQQQSQSQPTSTSLLHSASPHLQPTSTSTSSHNKSPSITSSTSGTFLPPTIINGHPPTTDRSPFIRASPHPQSSPMGPMSLSMHSSLPPASEEISGLNGNATKEFANLNLSDGDVFRDATDQLKIRILDIVDQISGMHYERAVVEHDKSRTQMTQDTAKLSVWLQEAQQTITKQQHQQYQMQQTIEQQQKQLLDIQPQLAQHERRERETSLQTEIIMGHASVLTQMSVMALDKWSEMLQSTLNKINTIKDRHRLIHDKYPESSRGICIICQSSTLDTVLQPCGHQLTCANCIIARCPACDVAVTHTLPILHTQPQSFHLSQNDTRRTEQMG